MSLEASKKQKHSVIENTYWKGEEGTEATQTLAGLLLPASSSPLSLSPLFLPSCPGPKVPRPCLYIPLGKLHFREKWWVYVYLQISELINDFKKGKHKVIKWRWGDDISWIIRVGFHGVSCQATSPQGDWAYTPQRHSLAAQAPLHGSNIQRSGIWEKVQGGPCTFQKVEGKQK